MAAPARSPAYSIFILVLTIMSLAIMVLLLLPLDAATIQVLTVYDNIACVIFLIDFAINLRRAPSKRYFFIDQRGWLDLLGSIPTFGTFRFTALFRLARLSRLFRILRMLRGQSGQALVRDVLSNRGQYAALITVLVRVRRPRRIECAHPAVRVSVGRRQHHDRRRRPLVGDRDHHHGGLWRLLSRDPTRSSDRCRCDGRRCRDHRRTGEHPGQHPRPATRETRPARGGRVDDVGP